MTKEFDIRKIMEILPHRYPFLLVDKIVKVDLEAEVIEGQKNVTINEGFFQGHFPDAPLMPGVLILEALAQVGGVLVHLKGNREKIALLLSVNNAKFRKPVQPGDVLTLKAQALHISQKGGRVKAEAFINGDMLAVEAEIGFVLVNKNEIY